LDERKTQRSPAAAAAPAPETCARIAAPTLLVVAEWDHDTPPAGAMTIFTLLTNSPGKRLVVLAEGWAPWRSLAARLLWHHWRFVTGRPAIEDG
jgi:3-methyladenine DNA glycosylase/8-oxoguanine DNA glycosylase